MLFKFISYFFMLFWYKLGIHRNVPHDTPLPNCSIENKINGHYIFKQLSESVAKLMSQKMFLKTP